MIKKSLYIPFFFTLCVFSKCAVSAFMLDGTRFIYEEGKKNISVVVNNKSQQTFGGQAWIENIESPNSDVAFVPIPSFFKVDKDKYQLIRILKVTDSLSKEKESIFRLNVQEIPPINKSKPNAVIIAVNTQVKLIYRPKSLVNKRENAEKKIVLKQEGGQVLLKNPTPYYFAITALKINGHIATISKELSIKLGTFAPNSTILLKGINIKQNSPVILEAIDDYGAIRKYTIK
ncbi:fimbrial chaperone [Photobacterium leiognathi]|uniref:fimbrial chaperone n=1 Tax=Photobacterium leiognathi TaxID=553611 RepID=UPI002982A52F|nr:fimbrial chaperone [Photobacterium leiognathi]